MTRQAEHVMYGACMCCLDANITCGEMIHHSCMYGYECIAMFTCRCIPPHSPPNHATHLAFPQDYLW